MNAFREGKDGTGKRFVLVRSNLPGRAWGSSNTSGSMTHEAEIEVATQRFVCRLGLHAYLNEASASTPRVGTSILACIRRPSPVARGFRIVSARGAGIVTCEARRALRPTFARSTLRHGAHRSPWRDEAFARTGPAVGVTGVVTPTPCSARRRGAIGDCRTRFGDERRTAATERDASGVETPALP